MQRRSNPHGLISVVIDHARNGDLIPNDKEAGRFKPHDQWLFGSRRGVADAELISRGDYAHRCRPGRQRIGIFHFHRCVAVLVGVDVRLPENGRAKIVAHLNRGLLAWRRRQWRDASVPRANKGISKDGPIGNYD